MASLTQSTGVPEVLWAVTPLMGKYADLMRNISPMVTACPIPDCGLSGATTWMSPRSKTASARELMPFDEMPSSLVINMRGRFDMIYERLGVRISASK